MRNLRQKPEVNGERKRMEIGGRFPKRRNQGKADTDKMLGGDLKKKWTNKGNGSENGFHSGLARVWIWL